jgi:hypothetical protein
MLLEDARRKKSAGKALKPMKPVKPPKIRLRFHWKRAL